MLRPFPYPFASALSIVSDVDGADRQRYDAYVGLLVGVLGLDFGDSVWLRMSAETPPAGIPVANTLGFFSRHFNYGTSEEPHTFSRTRTFFETLAEFHLGNLDHFHAFLSKGPRVAILEDVENAPGRAQASPRKFEVEGMWRCGDAYVDGICVTARADAAPKIASVIAIDVKDRETRYDRLVSCVELRPGVHQLQFAIAAPVDDEIPQPQFNHVSSVVVELEDPAHVERILLVSGTGPLILERLTTLREKFNVETSLITEHSAFHFRAAGMAERRDALVRAYLKEKPGVIAALNGMVATEDGDLVFATDADDRRSVSRVLPEVSTDLEVRFLVPQAATSTSGWPLDKLISPLNTRAGVVAYQAQRTFVNILALAPGQKLDGTQTRQENFAPRIANALAAADETPGLFWPIYTHLGGITTPKPDRSLPDPYFELGPMHALQDRMFDVSSSVAPANRVWVARGTTFYDYALLARSVEQHAQRSGEDGIDISSWHDPVLNKMLPRSVSQLFGLTFYVEDPVRAEVRLDGRAVTHLVRNKRDETGKHSVTVAECEIRYPVFAHLDPMRGDAQVEQGSWAFHPAEAGEPAFGRLVIGEEGWAKLRIPTHGWQPTGAQLVSFLCRSETNAKAAIVLETERAGRFFFGYRRVVDRADKLDARYIFMAERPENWRRLVAPFYDMIWAEGAAPGGPMPNHPLAAVELLCVGKPGSHVDIGDLALLRPRATSLGPDRGYCLGGTIPDFRQQQEVHVALEDGSGALSQAVDQRGRFCFSGLAKGIYRVWTQSERGELHDRRGALVELGGDTMYLLLNRLKASAPGS